MSQPPRVAFFADSSHEINGAARCCRELEAYARRKQLPFLSIHYGPEPAFERDGTVSILQLKRSKIAVPVDADLDFDLTFYRHRRQVEQRIAEFQPDLVHITSPGDAGILGAIAAHRFRVPMVASWHTNVHEFASRRASKILSFLPARLRQTIVRRIERFTLNRAMWFFGRSRVLLAPSPELVSLLRERTGRPVLYMGRGVDMTSFNPDQRERTDNVFTIGYVGRLMPEKNVRFLAHLERELLRAGKRNFRFLIVGGGEEREWLEANMQTAQFTGILHGNDLGRAFANMDVFAFPSRTDTFGQVVQEAQSSGVPPVVTSSGGPQFLVEHGVTGLVAKDDAAFISHIVELMENPERRAAIGVQARRQCNLKCWERIFLQVYIGYELCITLQSQQQQVSQRAARLLPGLRGT